MKYLLGYDIGSSSVKAALVEVGTGKPVATVFSPAAEMPIASPVQGFAEQDPDMWWKELIRATQQLRQQTSFQADEIGAIGISYQMHGLVCVDQSLKSLRPSIIWCDSRAVDIGNTAAQRLGENFCLQHFLNSPGNFTASKLKWVKDNEPAVYEKIYKVMLPGDYIALKLSGDVSTTVSGLSEGIFWDYSTNSIATSLLKEYGIDESLLSPIVQTFGIQTRLSASAGELLQLKAGTPVSYRAGDQPNNAYALNVLQPGEIAATAGTSGVVYGVTDVAAYDQKSRVNTFVHVNHTNDQPRYGVLLCINGTGILNSWLRKNFFAGVSYNTMNQQAEQIAVGADGIKFYPFGNGSERILENADPGAGLKGLQFNRHHRGHIARAAQEGIVFAMNYGIEIMKAMDMNLQTVRAGESGIGWVGKNANLLTREQGSFFFIATLITDLDLEYDNPFIKDYCGSCRKCIDACPTDAILEERVVDGSRCISYFTIELKDALIPGELKNKFNDWMFGCDICQDVCPWNRFSKPTNETAFTPIPEILNFTTKEWEALSEESFKKIFQHSAIKRSKFKGIQRNLKFLKS